MIVYATDECLRLMCRARTWFVDGNYAMALEISRQLYVIRVPLGEIPVSCVYVFLSGKSQRVGFTPNPTEIVIYFEKAAMQVFSSILGSHISTKGCFFHLTHGTWCKIQELGLVNRYRENDDCRLFCGLIDGFAFLPIEKVKEGMVLLKDYTHEEFENLLSYFDRAYYVTGTFRHVQPLQNNTNPESL